MNFFNRHLKLAALILGLGASDGLRAESIARGAWIWRSPKLQFGTESVIASPADQTTLLKVFDKWQIKRLYGSYGTFDGNKKVLIGDWNQKLAKQGIDSYILLSTTEWIWKEKREVMLRYVQENYLNFNLAQKNPQRRFKGVALDLEPITLTNWKSMDAKARKESMHAMAEATKFLDRFLAKTDPSQGALFVALPYWLDTLPPSLGGKGGMQWSSIEERDLFFENFKSPRMRLNLMTFNMAPPEQVVKACDWELKNFPHRATIALRVDQGHEWKSLDQMKKAMVEVESLTGSGIDVQSIEKLMELNIPLHDL